MLGFEENSAVMTKEHAQSFSEQDVFVLKQFGVLVTA